MYASLRRTPICVSYRKHYVSAIRSPLGDELGYGLFQMSANFWVGLTMVLESSEKGGA